MGQEQRGMPDRTGLEPAEALGREVEPGPGGPNYALWLVDLFLRPRKFFREYIHDHLPALTALCAWFAGIAGGLDRLESRLERGRLTPLEASWPAFLGALGAISVISALLYFKLGGWWYAKRVTFCGVASPEIGLVRRVYLYAQMVFALPVLASLLNNCLTYATPIEAARNSGGPWDFAVLLFLFWSVVTSYVGVRTVFGVRGWKPVVWFLALPMAIYGLAILALIVAIVLGLSTRARDPDVRNPISVTRQTIEFSHPGDWWVETSHPDYDPELFIPISMPADAMVILRQDDSGEEPATGVWSELSGYGVQEGDQGITAFDRWGAISGYGRAAVVDMEGEQVVLRVFATRLREGRLFIAFEACLLDDATTLRPGFEFIGRTVRFPASGPR